MRHRFGIAALLVTTLVSSLAEAHRPIFGDRFYGTMQTAFPIRDPAESIVVNHTVTCDHQAVWLRFQAHAGDQVYFEVGVPKVDRFDGYRPKVALIGPGFDKSGSVAIDTGGMPSRELAPLAERKIFVDKESSTSSWVYVETTETMPQDGTYYVAAWPEDFQTGKLWVAVGTKETFTKADFSLFPIWIEEMDLFYEKKTSGEPVAQCEPARELTAVTPAAAPPQTSSGGCAASPRGAAGGGAMLLLVPLALVMRRRRNRTHASR